MLGLKSLVAVASAVVLFAQASAAASVPELGVSKRGVSNTSNAVARRNAVKAALARRREERVKRGRPTWGQRVTAAPAAAAAAAAPAAAAAAPAAAAAAPPAAAPAVANDAPVSAVASSGAFSSSVLTSGSATLAAANIRCGSAFTCVARTSPPANAAAICLTGRCAFSCNTGYGPSSDGSSCVASAGFCGGNACVQPQNGYTTCSADGSTCVPGCNTGYGGITSSSGVFRCVNPNTDATYCGSSGTVCPASYNGLGEPICSFGLCRLACPAGSFQRAAQSTTNPLYCYNGEGSLVQN